MKVIMSVSVDDDGSVSTESMEVSGHPSTLNNLPYGKVYSAMAMKVVGEACIAHAMKELEKGSE